MEAIGAIASTLQIAGQCAQCTMTIVQWYRSVKTVDERIESFKHEIYTLQTTYETLRATFADQSKLRIANTTNKDAGGRLARQLESTLREGESAIIAINNELRRIQSTSNTVFRPIIKQVRESLSQGELARHRERIVLLNHELHLVLQMMTVSLSLQQDVSVSNQIELEKEMAELRQSVTHLTRQLALSRRTFSVDGTTIADDVKENQAWPENKVTEEYIESANRFLETASAAVTARSAASTAHPDQDQYSLPIPRRGSTWAPLSDYKLSTIGSFVENLPDETNTPLASDAQSPTSEALETVPGLEDDEVEIAIVNALLSAGQSEIDAANYSLAAENFCEAHQKLSETDFGSNVIATMSDVTLSLAFCYVKQEKYEEAVDLLRPLYEAYSETSQQASTRRIPDQGEALTACHMLGEVYLKKADFGSAEKYSTRAFKERKTLLGLQHPKTQDSVKLVIEVYEANGRGALAKAHQSFQRTPQELHMGPPPVPTTISRSSTSDQSASAADLSPSRTRRPTFHFPSRFRRGEKEDSHTRVAPRSSDHALISRSPDAVDGHEEFSTSPRDPSGPSQAIQKTPPMRRARLDSTNSNTSIPPVHRWSSSGDVTQDASVSLQQGSLATTMTRSSTNSQPAVEANMSAIRDLSKKGFKNNSVKASLSLMKAYDPDKAILVQREDELRKNIEKSNGKGLAGTGYGYAPIHFFCSLRHEALVEVDMLIKHGANINAVAFKAGMPGKGAFTPLSRAVERGHVNIVQLLLDHAAHAMPPEIESSRDGQHPLLMACRRGHADIVASFLSHGVMVTEHQFRNKQWHGNSLLHEASYRCDLPMVKLLVSYHYQHLPHSTHDYTCVGHAAQQDAFGMTPVMNTVDMRDASDAHLYAHKERNRLECLRLLLEPQHEAQLKPDSDDSEEDGIVVETPVSIDNKAENEIIDLHVQDEKGHSVFWYLSEDKDEDVKLRAFLHEYSRKSRLIDFE